ncbi:MAG: hypothetical protein OXU73_01440 [Candidatus Campbellbacteria bacterium]|nr:hypothetical protein [Candidatus Campbellbacteria bacterium]
MFKVIAIILIVAGIITITISLLGGDDNGLIDPVPGDVPSVRDATYFSSGGSTEINGFSYTFPSIVVNDYFKSSNWPPIITEVERRECQEGVQGDGYEYIAIPYGNGYCIGGKLGEGFDFDGNEVGIQELVLYGETDDGNFVKLETALQFMDCTPYGSVPNECITAQSEAMSNVFHEILIDIIQNAKKV